MNPPLATGLILFFFVTGMSLAISLTRRKEWQTPLQIGRHVIFRYSGYVLAAILILIGDILMNIIFGVEVNAEELVQRIVSGAIFSGPIKCLGLTAILAFPIILYLPWRKLMIASLAIASAVCARASILRLKFVTYHLKSFL